MDVPLWMWIWYFILPWMAVLFWPVVAGVGFWFYRNRRLPPVARILNKAKQEGMPPAIITHGSGRASIQLFRERRGEGIMISDDGYTFKILPRFVGVPTRRKGTEEEKPSSNPTSQDLEKPEEKTEFLKSFSDIITKRHILTGLGLPIFFGSSDTLCLCNPETVALIEAGEMYIETADKVVISEKGKKKREKLEGEGKDWRKVMMQPLMLLHPRKIAEYINRMYDSTQINSCLAEAERIGYEGRPSVWAKRKGLIMLFVILLIGGAALFFVPQLLPK